MASQQTPQSQASTLRNAEAIDGLAGILGARRFKSAGRPKPRRDPEPIRPNDRHAYRLHRNFSDALSTPWRRSVAHHRRFNSSNGRVRASRFGNTRSACSAASSPRTCRDNSRKRRFARFRRTAMPNRLPTTIPTRVVRASLLQTSRLKQAVDSRRPWCFTYSMSRLARRKKDRSPVACDIVRLIEDPRRTHPPHSYVPSWAGPLHDALGKRPCLRKTRGAEVRTARVTKLSNAPGLWLDGEPRLSGRFLCSCVCGNRVRASF